MAWPTKIRVAVETTSLDTPFKRKGSSKTPAFYAGTGLRFELSIFTNSVLQSVADVQDLTVSCFAASRSGNPYFERTIAAGAMDNTTTAETWADDTKQHAAVEFTADETELAIDSGQNQKDYFLCVHGHTTDGEPVTFGWTTLRVIRDGVSTDTPGIVQAGNLVTEGAVYVAGAYTVSGLSAGYAYRVTFADNEESMANGGETLTSSGIFWAEGTTVVLTSVTGEETGEVTAVVRRESYPTIDEMDARYLRLNGAANMTGDLTFVANKGLRGVGDFYLGTNMRVTTAGKLCMKFSDDSWHEIQPAIVGDQYTLDVKQSAEA